MSTDDKKPAPAAQSSGPQGLLMGGVVLVLVALGAVIWLIVSAPGGAPANNMAEAETNGAAPAASAMPNRGRLLPSGLRIETIREGTGAQVARTDTPLVRYELRVAGREQVLESNFDQPQPIPMPLDGVIPGFAEALTQMRAGGEARFWVPPSLGYGPATPPSAPFGPNDVLEFRVRVEGLAPATRRPAPPAATGESSNATDAATETQNRS
ncbi:MAG TPA: FKBP-type peptidyl-prolyl cis-trans isomerase [Allosphingosinicella sp.]|nr:FKBP-type peptidyl-prolyl cis-trans isomerase [Allosphingosinicella sp.]